MSRKKKLSGIDLFVGPKGFPGLIKKLKAAGATGAMIISRSGRLSTVSIDRLRPSSLILAVEIPDVASRA